MAEETPCTALEFSELESHAYMLGMLEALAMLEKWRNQVPETRQAIFQELAARLVDELFIDEMLQELSAVEASLVTCLRARMVVEDLCFKEAFTTVVLAREKLLPGYLEELEQFYLRLWRRPRTSP